MIIVQLTGGIGNQMFQYAAGRHLASIHNTVLKLWWRQPGRDTSRQFSLGCFKLKPDFATKSEVRKITRLPVFILNSLLYDLVLRLPVKIKWGIVRETSLEFNPDILSTPDNIYLQGFWQSEKYFKDIEGVIREDFTFTSTMSQANKDHARKIKSSNSVSIHVRRGDYVHDIKTFKFHGICDLNYYHKAVSIIADKIRQPVFFIFSDEPSWVEKNLKLNYSTFYINNNQGRQAYEDMRLMSLCRHNIIANSSFSWWGAWLNTNRNKVVIAPKRWFRDLSIDTRDRFPKHWLRL